MDIINVQKKVHVHNKNAEHDFFIEHIILTEIGQESEVLWIN